MPHPPKPAILATIVVVFLATLGCQQKIGDGCSLGTDCSTSGDRSCDTTLPGGYCTMANCEPDSCPSEAACIAFMLSPSAVLECATGSDSREVRTYCMRTCSSNSDCRNGYVCVDLNQPNNGWSAQRIDRSSTDGRVCVIAYTATSTYSVASDGSGKEDYCTASPFKDEYGYYAVGGSSGTYGGTAGTSGTASGTAGTSGTASGTAGTSGTASGTAGTSGTASGTAGTSGTASGTAGTSGTASGAAGALGSAGTAGAIGVLGGGWSGASGYASTAH
jgi:hypothetical protein